MRGNKKEKPENSKIYHPYPNLPEAVKKFRDGELGDPNHVQGAGKFACQNEAVISSSPGGIELMLYPNENLVVITRVRSSLPAFLC